MRLTFWLSIGLLAVALSACGPDLALPPADAEGDATLSSRLSQLV
jgi:hypothetical protein